MQIRKISHILQKYGSRRFLQSVWLVAVRENRDVSGTAVLLSMEAESALAVGDHQEVRRISNEMLKGGRNPVGKYYLARSSFYQGQYKQAIELLFELQVACPNHADAAYLLSECAVLENESELAWRVLEKIARVSKRRKTWLVLANLINTKSDFYRLLSLWQDARNSDRHVHNHPEVREYIALGALRCGAYDFAKRIWQDSALAAVKSRRQAISRTISKPNYTSEKASVALMDLKSALELMGIPMFLISGTLLGCVRENSLLGHDKDIDVGIWDDVPRNQLLTAIRNSGKFSVLASRAPELLRIKHVTGVAIDVFYHYRTQHDYWHGGVKIRWHNTPFRLVERRFLGDRFLIPEDWDLYLTENYGDWRTPKHAFDSSFDTPNAEVINRDEMVVYIYKMLTKSLLESKLEKADFYLSHLLTYGEKEAVKKIQASLNSFKHTK